MAKDMDDQTFNQSLGVLRLFEPDLIAMNGCGEPLMDPKILERMSAVAELGYKPRIITNGDFLDESVLKELKQHGMSSLMISPHGDISTIVSLAKGLGINVVAGYSPTIGGRTHNWAGQLDAENELSTKCNPLLEGRGYINVDGYVVQCCLDYLARYPLGHVSDGYKLRSAVCGPIGICKDCGGSP